MTPATSRPCARGPWAPGAGRALRALPLVLGLLLAGVPAAPAAEHTVPSAATPSLATALQRAVDGDVILLAAGTYPGPVRVSRAITLQGAPGEARPVIDGGAAGHVLELAVPGITVRGLAVRNSGDQIERSDACIYVRTAAARARVLDNRLEDCAFGIWVNGTAGVEVAGNSVRGRPHPLLSDRGNGINLWQIRAGRIHDNDIAQVRDGIYLSVTTDSVVADNHMRDLRFGVHYMYSDHNRVSGNVTCDSHVGMALMYSKRLEILDNAAIGNSEHGILFRSILDSRIEDNLVQGNQKGFFLNDASHNEIRGNRLVDNAIGVHVTGGSEDNQVVGNAFVHNQVQVRFAWNYPIRWDDGRLGNYWSDYLGWDLDGDRIGDRSYYAVGTMDRLMFRYPLLKVLAASPVVTLLQSLEARFPVLRPASIVDARPALALPPLAGKAARDVTPEGLCGARAVAATRSAREAS